MSSQARQTRGFQLFGLAFVLVVLLVAYALTSNRAFAASSQAAVPTTSGTVHFIQIAYASTLSGDSTFINNVYTNNNSGALLFVTPNLTPFGDIKATADPHPIGVWYDTFNNEWAIFNEDLASMPLNAAFNVMVVPQGSGPNSSIFFQTAASYNTIGDFTLINNNTINGNPYAQLLITQNWDPYGGVGTYNNHNVGVWYDSSAHEWAIFNEDGASMTINAKFNVMVGAGVSGGGTEFFQTTTVANRSGNLTTINNPATNSKPDGVLFVTSNFNPGNIGGVYNPHPTAVQYNTGTGAWAISNQDGATMPLQAAFNVIAFPS